MTLRMSKSQQRLGFYFIYILLVWGSFRYFVRLPEVIEELWFKPVIWLMPLVWWQFSLHKKIELFLGGVFPTLLWGIAGGLIYFVILRLILPGGLVVDLNKTGIALVTAVVEELTFAGFILSLLMTEIKKEIPALSLTGLGFALIHLPVNLFVFRLSAAPLVGAFLLAFFVALINGFLRLRSKNVLSAVIAHFIYLVLVLG